MPRLECNNCGNVFDSRSDSGSCPYCGSMCYAPSGASGAYSQRTAMRSDYVMTRMDAGADLFERVKNGVLEISCVGKKGTWSGSGYIITPDGYAMTNAHVAADESGKPLSGMNVNVCGRTVKASVVALGDDKAGSGSGVDLALIKLASVPMGAVALTLADFDDVHTGEMVYVLGNSMGDGTCITSGIVSDKNRLVGGKKLLMTDCAINGGNSGGPIFNADAEVIGTICSSRIKRDGSDTKGMNYAVPVDIVKSFLKKNRVL